jgi:hypothetical protein
MAVNYICFLGSLHDGIYIVELARDKGRKAMQSPEHEGRIKDVIQKAQESMKAVWANC